MGSGRLDISSLVSKAFPIERATEAYALLKKTEANPLGVLLQYPETPEVAQSDDQNQLAYRTTYIRRPINSMSAKPLTNKQIRIGVIGCGGFVKNVHLPNLLKLKESFNVWGLASQSGGSAGVLAKQHEVEFATSDYKQLLAQDEVQAVLIGTRHASHAEIVLASLDAGKHVFVEKPLCLTVEEGEKIVELSNEKGLVVNVGFNRRFSPMLVEMKRKVGTGPNRIVNIRVQIPASQFNHWSNTKAEGGRFLGEGVHFLDLANWFIESNPISVFASSIGEPSITNSNLAVIVSYQDGSVAQISYSAVGGPGLGKEFYEVFGNGVSLRCDNFLSIQSAGTKIKAKRSWKGDKGHLIALDVFAALMKGKSSAYQAADANAGLSATELALAVYVSAKEKNCIHLQCLGRKSATLV